MRWLDGIMDSMDMSLRKLHDIAKDRDNVLQSMGSQGVGHNLTSGQQQGQDFPGGSVLKNTSANTRDLSSVAGPGGFLMPLGN